MLKTHSGLTSLLLCLLLPADFILIQWFHFGLFSICGYSNKFSLKRISDEDFSFVEDFVKNELDRRLLEKSESLKIKLEEPDKKQFFGEFVKDPVKFHFTQRERSLLVTAAKLLAERDIKMSPSKEKKIHDASKLTNLWFSDESNVNENKPNESSPPKNLLEKMNMIAQKNSQRPKQGYRYDDNYKRFCVYNRILAGPTAFNLLHLNLDGCLPSVSTMNRYIHRSDHAVVEGELRVEELLLYLKDRKLPLWVSLSEDATRVENRVKYDLRTNQIIGFVLPTNQTGMPIPLRYKARNIDEIMDHFSKNIPVANFINTVMAQPLGSASPFCLLVFGTNGQYTAHDVSMRWKYIANELERSGIHVLTISSDSDPRYNSAMRLNSDLGHSSNDSSSLFKCGTNPCPPFYVQDHCHILTKLRNLFLKSIECPKIFKFGNSFVQQQHIEELLSHFDKDKHGLTSTCLNPIDRQNVESAKRICDRKVISLLKQMISGSEGTAQFLQIMSDVYSAFEDKNLQPLERVKKLWRSLFLVRIWRQFVLNHPGLTLKTNFMSSNCFYCIEQNAHSMVLILRYLRNEQLMHLYSPSMYSSQPCESFYRQLRSLTPVGSTVVNCDMKGILDRISRIHLLNEISNDTDSGFTYPKALNAFKCSTQSKVESFPSDSEIINTIKQCKEEALIMAMNVGLIKESLKSNDSLCICPVIPYEYKMPKAKKVNEQMCSDLRDEDSDLFHVLYTKTITASLKNFASKFGVQSIAETSSYVEIQGNRNRLVFKKASVCWLLGKNSYKCSSDRVIRVRLNSNQNTKKNTRRNAKQTKKTKRLKILRISKFIKKIEVAKK